MEKLNERILLENVMAIEVIDLHAAQTTLKV